MVAPGQYLSPQMRSGRKGALADGLQGGKVLESLQSDAVSGPAIQWSQELWSPGRDVEMRGRRGALRQTDRNDAACYSVAMAVK